MLLFASSLNKQIGSFTPRASTSTKQYFSITVRRVVAIVLLCAALSNGAAADITTGLAGWWKFDENYGSATADSAGSNTASLINTPNWVGAKIGNGALSFNGSSSHVTVPASSALEMAGSSVTVAVWIKNSVPFSGERMLIEHATWPNGNAYHLVMTSSGSVAFNFPNLQNVDGAVGASFTLSDGNWHHVVGVLNDAGNVAELYIDGTLQASKATSQSIGSGGPSQTFIAARSGTSIFFPGSMDDVRIYNRALSAADVTALYGYTQSDTTAPSVAVTAPVGGAAIWGTSTAVTASASDNVGVLGVQFRLDGVNLGAEDTNAPFAIVWDSTTAINGTHTLTAVARDASGNTATSAGVQVTVANISGGSPPMFAAHPQSASVPAGGSVSFSATASGGATINQQWQRSAGGVGPWNDLSVGGSYAQVLGPVLVINSTTIGMSGDAFRCVATSSSGSATSNSATLTVAATAPSAPVAFPVISMAENSFLAMWSNASAAGYRIDVATDASFTNYVSGYQNVEAGTALSQHKWISGMTAGSTYYFRVRAYNSYGTSANSNVIEGPKYIATQTYTSPGAASYTLPGTTNRIRVEVFGAGGDSSGIGVNNNEGFLYNYTANGGAGGYIRAAYAVSSGSVNIRVGTRGGGPGMESSGGDASAVWRVGSFQVIAGGGGGAGGSLDNDEEEEALGGAGGNAGANGSGTVSPGGGNGGGGATSSQAGQGNINGGGPLNLIGGASYAHNGGGNGGAGYYGGGGGYGVWLGHYGNAVGAGGGGGSSYFSPSNGYVADSAFTDDGAGGAGGTDSSYPGHGKIIVHSYDLPNSTPRFVIQPLALTLGVVNADVALSAEAFGLPAPQYQWRKDGVNIGGATNPNLTLTTIQITAGATYTVVASNSAGSVTSNGAVLAFPPALTLQPQSQSVNSVGGNVTFTSTTVGYPAPTYQWKKNGVNISGATQTNLTLTNVQAADFASYSLVATNAAGAVTTTTVTLSLDTPPTAPPWLDYAEKTSSTVSLIWGASADDVAVSHYLVYRGATQIGLTTELTFWDLGLTASTAYAYTVKAVDNTGKISSASSTLNLTTNASSSVDTDNDGLPNLVETALGTNTSAAATADTTNQTQPIIHRPPQTAAP